MLMGLLISIVKAVFAFFIYLLLVRAWMIAFRLPFRHQLGDFIRLCTGWMTRPFEGRSLNHTRFVVIPLALAWALQFILIALLVMIALSKAPTSAILAFLGPLALVALTQLLSKALMIAIVVIIFQAVLSWVNPYAPIMGFLMRFTAPLMRPVRRVLPTVSGIDFSPMVVILVCALLRVVLFHAEAAMMSEGPSRILLDLITSL